MSYVRMMEKGKLQPFSVVVDGLRIAGEVHYPPGGEGSGPALCICHGIPAAVPPPAERGYRLLAEWFAREGFVTAIFNFRGCGESEGNLDLLDWTRDLVSVITYLDWLEGVDGARISVMGFSGGAAASACVAARDDRISALVLCACPAEFSVNALGGDPQKLLEQCRDVGTIRDENFPSSVDEWADHFRQVSPIDCIGRISPRPLLIIHGDQDETIPPWHASRLYEEAGEPRKLVMIPGGGHRLRTSEMAMREALQWLKRVTRMK